MTVLLRFPGAFRRMRIRRGLLQKSVAYQLRLDPGLLCAIEKGARSPFDQETLERAAELLELSKTEQAELSWTAHHDRLVGLLCNRGATPAEIELISASLLAWHHLQADQRDGLIRNVRRLGESAQFISTLSSPEGRLEGFT